MVAPVLRLYQGAEGCLRGAGGPIDVLAACRGFGCARAPLRGSHASRRRVALTRLAAAAEASAKSLEAMRKFSEQYAKNSGTFFCSDKSVTAVVIQGLAVHKDELGAPLCPCRHYDDKPAEVANGFWNCPCVPMRERKECHCMLFLTKENDFAGTETTITPTELTELTAGM